MRKTSPHALRVMLMFGLFAAVGVGGVGCAKGQEAVAVAKTDEHASAGPGESAGHDAHGDAGADVVLDPAAVKSAGIVSREISRAPFGAEVRVPGIVASTPNGRAVVTSPVEGRVLKLLATVGQRVERGQALATVESVGLAERAIAVGDAERALRAAQAEAVRLGADVRLAGGRARSAEITLKRQRDLSRTGAFSRPTLQAAQRELNDARAELAGAQKEAVVHAAQLERSERLYGQELVSRIEVENARLDVAKDQIAQDRAAKATEIARAAYERERTIAAKGLLNAREIGTAEADVRAARLEVERARSALRLSESAVGGARKAVSSARDAYAALKGSGNAAQGGRLTVAAPIGGMVVHREITVGAALERTTELFEIDDLREVWVTAQVPEGEIAGLRVGAPVTVTTAAAPGKRFAGRVQTIGGRLDPKTRTLPVQCLVPNPGGTLRPEMFAEVTLSKGGTREALAVPNGAAFADGGKSYVYVEEEPGRYARREVTLGAARYGAVEVARGLEPGARVVVEGVFTLRSQAKKDELKGHED